MTVAELIKKLQQFRPDAMVEVETKGYDGIGNEHSTYIDPIEVAQYCNEDKPTVTILGQERS